MKPNDSSAGAYSDGVEPTPPRVELRPQPLPATASAPPPRRRRLLGRRKAQAPQTPEGDQSSLPQWLRYRNWPWWVRYSAIACLVLSVVALGSVVTLAAKYKKIAAAYDIEAVGRLEEGCLILGRKGEELGRIFIEDRRFVELEDVPLILKNAVIATEDSRFYSHDGFDKRGIARAALRNIKEMSIKQGASTITQQLARHAYDLTGRTFDRKFTEIFLAKRLEERYSKDEILERYLNRIYLGSGFYGVGSAARGYFGKEIGELSLPEAATVAGIIKSPSIYSPFADEDEAMRVRNLTLRRMRSLDMISSGDYESASTEPVSVLPESQRSQRPFFALEAARREVEATIPKDLQLDRGVVQSTLDNQLTNSAIQAIQSNLNKAERRGLVSPAASETAVLQAATIVIENRTGRIIAAVGGRDYRKNQFDRALLGRRPPGTAFLPMTYAAYFASEERDIAMPVLDAPLDNAKVMIGGTEGMLAEWGDASGQFEGEIPAGLAFLNSKTNCAVRAGNQAGLAELTKISRAAGIASPLRPYPASFLGASEIKLVELARAFTIFPNAGTPCPQPYMVENIQGPGGENYYFEGESLDQIPPAVAADAANTVREIMAARLRSPRYDSILAEHDINDSGLIGQAGSAYGFTDAWFVGSDRNLTCAVWVGYTDGSRLGESDIARQLAMPVWAEIMAAATDTKPSGWRIPSGELAQNKCLCLVSGKLSTDGCRSDRGGGVVDASHFAEGDLRSFGICSIHGEGSPRRQIPKAIPATTRRIASTDPIAPQSPLIRGADPFRIAYPKAIPVQE